MNEQTFYQLFLNLRYFLELDQIYSFSPISGTQKQGASNVASVYGLSIPAMIAHSVYPNVYLVLSIILLICACLVI